ncbi:MAG: Hint domain-containing protein [Pseudomonadota bacterium]
MIAVGVASTDGASCADLVCNGAQTRFKQEQYMATFIAIDPSSVTFGGDVTLDGDGSPVVGTSGTVTVADGFTTVELDIDDDDGAFQGDIGANEVGADDTQVVTGTTINIYGESTVPYTNEDGSTGLLIAVEENESEGGESDIVGYLVVGALPDTGVALDTTIGNVPSSATFAPAFADIVPACFTPGTMIDTPEGAKEITELKVGDLVMTADRGAQPIRWIGRRQMLAAGGLSPVVFAPGAIGNDAELRVSPCHRMVVSGRSTDLFFGESEVLVAARDLVNGGSVTVAKPGVVEYIHLMFDQHEIVTANGVPSESYKPSAANVDALAKPVQDELFTIFPELREDLATYGATARRTLQASEVALIAGDAVA